MKSLSDNFRSRERWKNVKPASANYMCAFEHVFRKRIGVRRCLVVGVESSWGWSGSDYNHITPVAKQLSSRTIQDVWLRPGAQAHKYFTSSDCVHTSEHIPVGAQAFSLYRMQINACVCLEDRAIQPALHRSAMWELTVLWAALPGREDVSGLGLSCFQAAVYNPVWCTH